MEFKGIGVIPYEPPSEELKPFFRVKGLTFFRKICAAVSSDVLRREHVDAFVKGYTNYITDSDEKSKAIKRITEQYENFLLYNKESINEQEYMEGYLKMVYSDAEYRKWAMHFQLDTIDYMFDPIDTNKNGVIDLDEFMEWYKIHNTENEFSKIVFDAIDSDKNGVISKTEWAYGLTAFHMHCGPDSLLKFWYGPLVNEE